MLLSELSKFMERWLEESHNVIQSNRRKKFARRRREVFMMTFEKSMEAHEIEHVKWQVFLTPQLTGKVQQAYAALSSKDSKNFTKVKEATFKHYGINEEMYYQRFQSAKAKEGESPTKIVTHLTDTVQITHNLNSPCVSHACHTRITRMVYACHTQTLDVITRVVSSLACAHVYSVIHVCKFKQCGMVFNQWRRTVKSS